MKRYSSPILDTDLKTLYIERGLSVQQIAEMLKCSRHRVDYYMQKYAIQRRAIRDAVYLRKNPDGDPFVINNTIDSELVQLKALGLGLYWGEGNKANKTSVRLGNTDPGIILKFVEFLEKIYGVDRSKLRFGLQLFSDVDEAEAISYWVRHLGTAPTQFYKTTITISGSIGTYRHKNKYGVVTVYFNNRKLRDILIDELYSLGMTKLPPR